MTPEGRAELEEERDFLLRSIRDLDAEAAAGDLDPADYQTLRDDYTVRAAAVLRALEAAALQAAPAAPWSAAGGERDRWRRRPWRTAALVIAVVAAALGTGFAVAGAAGERLATDEATGSLPEGSTDRIARAQALVAEGELLEAIKLYDQVLESDPAHPVARSERGWLLVQVGSQANEGDLVDRGLADIEAAVASEPGYAQAHFFHAMVLWRLKGDVDGARAAFERVLANRPPPVLAEAVEGFLAQLDAPAAP